MGTLLSGMSGGVEMKKLGQAIAYFEDAIKESYEKVEWRGRRLS